jgi:anaerobic selenocysteine-containing dehydrogenase
MDRRTFIKSTVAGGAAVSAFGFSLAPVRAQTRGLKIARTTETRSTCPYCSVSCGVIIHTLGDKAKNVVPQVVHVEGDPDHPINRGTLCPKGASLEQGYTVNRCEGIGWIGGCTDTNELNFLAVKAMRGMGVCYFETQARV